MLRIPIAVLLAALATSALAQSVTQSGQITPGQVPYWVSNGVIGAGGTAADSRITSLGVTSNSGAGFCVSSGRSTAAGRQQLCFGAPLNGPGTISLQNYGTATPQDLQFVVNGSAITLPTSPGTVFVTAVPPLTNNNYACWDGTNGVLQDCGGGVVVNTGTQGGIPYYSDSTTLTSSALLTQHAPIVGGGSGSAPSTIAAGTTGQIIIGNTGSAPSWLSAGSTGQILAAATASSPVWATISAVLDNIGSTRGSILYRGASGWAALTPGASGTALTSGGAGADPSWTALPGTGTVTSVSAGTGMSFTTITASGAVDIDKATTANLAAGTSNKVVTSDIAVGATALAALTPGATVTPDLNTAYNFTLTPNQNFTLANPSNISGKEGRSFCIIVTNDSTPRTITFGSDYYAPGGDSTIALTASAGAVDQLCFLVVTSTRIHVTITKNYTNS